MTERSPEELHQMRRRMEAAKYKPADIQHFFYALQLQPENEADRMWEAADRRLKAFEGLAAGESSGPPARTRRVSRRAYGYRRGVASKRRKRR